MGRGAMGRGVLLCAVVVCAHHGDDPFEGSNCTCSTFCDNKCAINATGLSNMTLYRMTPAGVFSLAEKDTGDVRGDTSFVLSRRTSAYQCRKDPNSFMCSGVTQFQGDDANSTDVVMGFHLEVDGEWGPYLMCNPINTTKPLGPWACKTSLSYGPTPPPKCVAANMSVYENYCFWGHAATTIHSASVSDCCAASIVSDAGAYTWKPGRDSATGTCYLFTSDKVAPYRCNGATSGTKYTPPCECNRVHKTVGRENLEQRFGSHGASMHPAGGQWFSHPTAGQCTGDQRPGDGSGCTWRIVGSTKSIAASCLYGHLDANVEARDPGCFTKCPLPKNITSDCYLECYSQAVGKMTKDELTAPWDVAFTKTDIGDGGCPAVPTEGAIMDRRQASMLPEDEDPSLVPIHGRPR